MNRNGALVGVAVAAVAVTAIGGWWAWESGLIGGNPRAPVARMMERATRMQATIDMMRQGGGTKCLPVNLERPPPEARGVPGIADRPAPGQFSLLMLEETDSRYQAVRDAQIAQLDFLATRGLLTRDELQIDSSAGVLPAARYGMTWDGYVAMTRRGGRSLCLSVGEREFAGIDLIEKSLEKLMDLEVYEVTYRTQVVGVPEWARAEEAAGLFPDLAGIIEDRVGHAKLVRGSDGWRSSFELEFEAAGVSRGKEELETVKKFTGMMFSAPPGADVVTRLFDEKVKEEQWITRHGVACLPLRIPRGGGDAEARRASQGPFTVTYLDRPDRSKYDFQTMATTLHVLSALEATGLASLEYLEPSGVRYRVSEEALAALELRGSEGCVPAGEIVVEFLGSRPGTGVVELDARATVSGTPGWTLELARHLPALRSLLENGMPMTGTISTISPQGEAEAQWRSGGLNPTYPAPAYESLPSHLLPVLPATAAAHPTPSIRAPTLASTGRIMPAPRAPPAESRAPQPTALAAKAVASTAAGPPFPASGSPVYVVSIYEPQYRAGERSGFDHHPEGFVHIAVRAPGATLILGAYEPTQWIVDAPRGIGIRRVIAIGHHDQRVKVEGGSRPEVITGRLSALLKESARTLPSSLPTRSDPNSLVDVAAISRALTGDAPASFQASYAAPAGGFAVEAGLARFELPTPSAAGSKRGTVGFRDGDSVRGLEVLRGRAGAYSDATADRSYSAGRVYFEGTMRVTRSLTAHTHANIGICLAYGDGGPNNQALAIRHGGQRLYADGDVFGVAADFDRGRVYHHVNGQWINGAPGSAGGQPLQTGKHYRACFFAAGTTTGDVERGQQQSDTAWRANFGGQRFEFPVPADYVPYE